MDESKDLGAQTACAYRVYLCKERIARRQALLVKAQKQIDEMRRRIIEQFQPERIILFGSHARGDANPDSDVDLLVVMEVAGARRRKAVEIGTALHDIGLPKDIIVATPEEFAWRKDVIGTIEHPAAHEGEVLYAKS